MIALDTAALGVVYRRNPSALRTTDRPRPFHDLCFCAAEYARGGTGAQQRPALPPAVCFHPYSRSSSNGLFASYTLERSRTAASRDVNGGSPNRRPIVARIDVVS